MLAVSRSRARAPVPRARFKKLPGHIQRRFADRIDSLSDEPRPVGVERLSDTDRLYRVRSGNYRVIYQIRYEVLLVRVVRIGDRKEIYRRLTDL